MEQLTAIKAVVVARARFVKGERKYEDYRERKAFLVENSE